MVTFVLPFFYTVHCVYCESYKHEYIGSFETIKVFEILAEL